MRRRLRFHDGEQHLCARVGPRGGTAGGAPGRRNPAMVVPLGRRPGRRQRRHGRQGA
ncbi:hypothetical protein XAP6164_4170007 [Xanthomonas phaseoli pv. phaseoli]|nr:hypothetical protein XAP6164_4170007 [Xanthomonas phaseoli pv. phaseoli]